MKNQLIIILLIHSGFIISDIKECTKIENDIKRLNCFDSYFSTNNDLKISEEFAQIDDLERDTFDEEYEKRNFGLPSNVRKTEDTEELKITSKIESVSQRLNLQLLIILENGQIWQSVEKIRDIKLRDGYEVEIQEGFFSGYTLKVLGKKIKLRVRRKN
ncbi:hypothetical protein OA500_00370 [Gammaproteobacteria bacterium]|nr:hypothetical protein [Gammaproteobacteria bacterium]